MPSPITVPTLVNSSLRLLGVLASGENATPEEINDALLCLNDLYENWSTEKMSVWGAANQTFALVPGQSTYTIGSGGNFNTVRPVYINDSYTTFSGIDSPVRSVSQEEYNMQSLKSMQQPVVEELLYVNDFPLGRITVWPVPSAAATITLSTARTLAGTITALDSLSGPPGFLKAIRYCLAVELAPEFGTEASSTVLQVAMDAKGDYKKSNQTEVVARFDDALVDSNCSTQDWRY